MFWIKLPYHLVDTEVFQDHPLWQLYTLLLMKAAPKTYTIHGIQINAGQCLLSRSVIASITRQGENRIAKRLRRLVELGLIQTTQLGVHGTLITINETTGDTTVSSGDTSGVTEYTTGDTSGDTEDTTGDTSGDTKGDAPTPNKDNKDIKDLNNSLSSRPTVEKIQAYLDEKQITDVDAEQFWNFYESKGWMVGKTPMKNWHAAIATWHRRGNTAKPSNTINTINTINTSNPFNTINTLPYGTTVNRIDLQAKQRNETIRRAIDALKSGAITISNDTDFLDL